MAQDALVKDNRDIEQIERTARGVGFLRLGQQEIASLLLFAINSTTTFLEYAERCVKGGRPHDARLFALLAGNGAMLPGIGEPLQARVKALFETLQLPYPVAQPLPPTEYSEIFDHDDWGRQP